MLIKGGGVSPAPPRAFLARREYSAAPGTSFATLRDLGVMMSEDANFNDYIEHVFKNTTQKMGWLLRTFRCRNNEFMKNTFNSLVQPHVDYCSQLWMPNQSQQMETSTQPLCRLTAR